MMQRLRKIISFSIHSILDFLFPKDPLVSRLESIKQESFLTLLGTAEPTHEIQDMFVLYDFKSPHTKTAIHQIKFNGNTKITEKIACGLYERLIQELSDKILFEQFTNPLLIPIPISKKRLKERGFNQCILIAESLKRHDTENHFTLSTKVLEKHKDIETQIGKSRKERLLNLKDCFRVINSKTVEGRNIILFDDVVTTGATMHEAERTLKRAGAKKVWCVALAH